MSSFMGWPKPIINQVVVNGKSYEEGDSFIISGNPITMSVPISEKDIEYGRKLTDIDFKKAIDQATSDGFISLYIYGGKEMISFNGVCEPIEDKMELFRYLKDKKERKK